MSRSRQLVAACAGAVALSLWACVLIENPGLGHFAPSAFYNEALPYRVRYRDPDKRSILGPAWTLENFVPVKKSRSRTVLEVEDRGEGLHDAVLLEDGDELERRFVHRQDLRFVHASGAQIWLSSAPLARRLAQHSLFELTSLHLQAIEEHGVPTAVLGAATTAKRFQSRVLSQRDVRVDGLKAFETTFELMAIGGGAASARYVRLVVLRAPFEWPIRGERFGTLVVLGYASVRAHFATHVAELERFVNQIEVDYDDALRDRTKQALACTEPSSEVAEVELEVNARGEITAVVPRRPWVDPNEPVAKQSEQAEQAEQAQRDRAKACLQRALAGLRLVATGEERDLRAWFDARLRAGVRVEGAYQTGPFTGAVIATEAATPAPASTQPATVASEDASSAAAPSEAPALPPAEPEHDAALRAQLEAHEQALLACMGKKSVALELGYQGGVLHVELGDPLRGSPEQACVRQVLRELTAPAGEGRVIHVLSSDR